MKRLGIIGIAVAVVLAAAALVMAGTRSGAWLGVYTQDVDDNLAEAFGLAVDRGAIINEIVEDSPADKAGLREDDIIVSLDNNQIRDADDLTDLVADRAPGDEVKLTVFRDDKEIEIQATLDKRPSSRNWIGRDGFFSVPRVPKAPRAPSVPRVYSYSFNNDDFLFGGERPYIGISMLDLSPDAAKNLTGLDYGVLINEVVKDSPAEAAGLKPGDLILAIDGEEVADAADVREIVADFDEGDEAKVEFVRGGDKQTVKVTVALDEDGVSFGRAGWLDLSDLDPSAPGIPHLKYLQRSRDNNSHDSEELRKAMKDYQREMEQLKKELSELKKSLE